jgi:flagellar motor switch protein FliM
MSGPTFEQHVQPNESFMNASTKVVSPTAAETLEVSALGRPVHRLGEFSVQLRKDLAAALRSGLNRRHRAAFDVTAVRLERVRDASESVRWTGYASEAGRICFAAERPLILTVLGYRFGIHGPAQAAFAAKAVKPGAAEPAAEAGSTAETADAAADATGETAPSEPEEQAAPAETAERIDQPTSPDDAVQLAPVARAETTERETATEERVGIALGEELAAVVAARIDAADLARPLDEVAPVTFSAAAVPVAAVGNWMITCTVREPELDGERDMWFALDDAWMDKLLHGLAHVREKKEPAMATAPFAARLQMTMTARLLSKDMPLGELFDLCVGDVIPVSIGSADVLIDDSRLYAATVAENKGKLCLTSFEDMD